MLFRLMTIQLACILTGCVPWPHFRYYAPAVEGVVTNNGVPVPNAEVKVSAQFVQQPQTAKTDNKGRFNTKAIKELQFFATLLGDPLFGYTVTITQTEQVEGFGEARVGYAPEHLTLTCDLSKPIQLRSKKRYCESNANE